jgi:hypothetical protein
MHKKSVPDKKTGARNRRPASNSTPRSVLRRHKKPRTINELLAIKPGLRRIAASIPGQQSWADWLRGALAADLAGHIVSAVPKNAELVVFADTAAWAMRLRYALAAMQSDIVARDSAISRTTVRVQMKSAPTTPPRA